MTFMTGVEMEWNCAITAAAGESPVVVVVSGELYLSFHGVLLLQAYTILPDVVSAGINPQEHCCRGRH